MFIDPFVFMAQKKGKKIKKEKRSFFTYYNITFVVFGLRAAGSGRAMV